MGIKELEKSIEGLPKHDFDYIDTIMEKAPTVIAIAGLIVTVIVFAVTV